MTQENKLTHPAPAVSLSKRMLLGAGVGSIIILLFLLGVNRHNPSFSEYWMVRPLVVMPLAGAACGAFYHIFDGLRLQYNWNKAVVVALSLLGCIIGMWLGLVLALAGTYWH